MLEKVKVSKAPKNKLRLPEINPTTIAEKIIYRYFFPNITQSKQPINITGSKNFATKKAGIIYSTGFLRT